MGRISIYAPQPTEVYETTIRCPSCEKHTKFIISCYEWHSPILTCMECGDKFDPEEGRYERPFAPKWREQNIRKAKAALERFKERSK